MLILDGLLLGLLVGFLSGGTFSSLANYPGKHIYWIPGLFVVQRTISYFGGLVGVPDSLIVWTWALAAVAMIVVLALQPREIGIFLAILGVSANLLVVAANGGMPVYVQVIVPLGGSQAQTLAALSSSGLHVAMTDATRIWMLADIIGVPGPSWHRGIVSIGDVLMSIGVGAVLFRATLANNH